MKYTDSRILYNGYVKVFKREINGVEREVVRQGNGTANAVALALFNRDKTKMLLVKQLRHSIAEYTWEIPAGMADILGEKNSECMVRELKEETGIELDPMDLTFEASFYPNLGVTDHRVFIYSAKLPEEINEEQYEVKGDEDVIEAKWFDIKDIRHMIRFAGIEDGKTVLAFSLLFKGV